MYQLKKTNIKYTTYGLHYLLTMHKMDAKVNLTLKKQCGIISMLCIILAKDMHQDIYDHSKHIYVTDELTHTSLKQL